MKNILTVIALFLAFLSRSQYYYNDIISTRQTCNKMKGFIAAGVRSVTATGYDENKTKTTNFAEWQEVQANGSVLKVTSRNGTTVAHTYYQFDDNTRLVQTRDSTGDIQIVTTYTYDTGNRLINILQSRKDSLHDFDESEERQWQYTPAGKPELIRRIVNKTDTTEYRFTLDEQGNVADETLYRLFHEKDTGEPVYFFYDNQKIYYYYDEKGRLTDIGRYNKQVKKMLPDFMFEYDENDRVVKKITTVSTVSAATSDYFTWRYAFNEKGLKIIEALFNKFKKEKGRIEYSYIFAQ